MADEKNGMETLAEAAFYITDVVAGRVGKFKIQEQGWGEGDAPRAYQEIADCLGALKDAGFKDKPDLALMAPYTHNIKRGVYYKKFPDGSKRYVVLILAERFGVDARFEVHTKKPW